MPSPLDDLKTAIEPFSDGKLDWRDVRGVASCLMIAATLLLTLLQVLGAPASESESVSDSGMPNGDTDTE